MTFTRADVEAKLGELATKAIRGGRMHRDYLDWHYQMDQLLDVWVSLVHPPIAPLSFSDAEGAHDATPTPAP